jgi:hypothetical protein
MNKPMVGDHGADQVDFIRLAGDRVLDLGEHVEHALRIGKLKIVFFEDQDGSRAAVLPSRFELGKLFGAGFAQAILAGFLQIAADLVPDLEVTGHGSGRQEAM